MSLFDSGLKEYVIKWELIGEHRPDTGEIKMKIQNQDGLDLGKFRYEFNAIFGQKFSVLDLVGNTLLNTAQKKGWKDWFWLIDSQGKELGILERKETLELLDVFLNMNEDEVLIAKTDSDQEGQIKDTQDEIIAEFSTEEEKIGRGFSKAPFFRTTHNLEIIDESFDRKVLLGFFSYILHNMLPPPPPRSDQ